MLAQDDFAQNVSERSPGLPLTLRRLANYIDQHRLEVISSSALELAARLGTSDASIVRVAKALGYGGLPHLKQVLARSMAQNPLSGFRQTLRKASADARKAAQQTLGFYQDQLTDLQIDSLDTLHKAAVTIARSQRLAFFGIGPTAHIVGYAVALLQRQGREVLLLNRTGIGLSDQLIGLNRGDCLVALTYGDPYPEIVATLQVAAELACETILVTDRLKSPLSHLAMLTACVPRGQAEGMSLHAVTVAWIDALMVAVSVLMSEETLLSLKRLEALRGLVTSASL